VIITNDLGVVAEHADNVMVMYAGRAAEYGRRDDIYYRAHHPYTWGLLQSITRLDQPKVERLRPIPGLPPSLIFVPSGCPFHPRCRYVMPVCKEEVPQLITEDGKHASACHLSLAEKERIFEEEVAIKG
jgi:peptide/nickel transport system ATP-binding protein